MALHSVQCRGVACPASSGGAVTSGRQVRCRGVDCGDPGAGLDWRDRRRANTVDVTHYRTISERRRQHYSSPYSLMRSRSDSTTALRTCVGKKASSQLNRWTPSSQTMPEIFCCDEAVREILLNPTESQSSAESLHCLAVPYGMRPRVVRFTWANWSFSRSALIFSASRSAVAVIQPETSDPLSSSHVPSALPPEPTCHQPIAPLDCLRRSTFASVR